MRPYRFACRRRLRRFQKGEQIRSTLRLVACLALYERVFVHGVLMPPAVVKTLTLAAIEKHIARGEIYEARRPAPGETTINA